MSYWRPMVQKIAVTIEKRLVQDRDRWVREGKFPNRSKALQSAVQLLAEREKRTRLGRELAKLDRAAEQQMAEEGLGDESWPAY
ncbi:MAG: ribbon-helix-helix domain-containing protein [Gammaproteobacteria bacterium]